MTNETVEALERIQAQIARLRNLQNMLRAMRSEGRIDKDAYTFEIARAERAIENVSSLYNLLLTEHRLRAIAYQHKNVQLSLF